ncbi:molybdenum ABC transporter ATP-binding protein [Marinobacter sp. V034]|uniref:molybdenum ABC transporter ATP-binding protein n=1 Tax=Marinobacter sp. V034 TaxID=3459610 RepID=UPI004044D991
MTLPQDALVIDVRKQQGHFRLDACVTIAPSGVTGLFGKSGSGKTTLLRLIAGLDSPDEGSIHFQGKALTDSRKGVSVAAHHRNFGVVFQDARLFPHYRVRGNLTYGVKRSDPQHFSHVIGLLGIEHLLDRYPATLSGGEARRVAIGRALLTKPSLLLMDEPLTGLDGTRKSELLRYIARLTRDIDIPIIYVSHDTDELLAIAQHLVLLDKGRLIADGDLETLLMRFDLTEHLGGFNAASVLDARVMSHEPDYGLTRVTLDDGQQLSIPAEDAAIGQRLRLRIPVRDVALSLEPQHGCSYRNQLRATIMESAPHPCDPAAMEIRLGIGAQSLRARLTRKSCDELGLVVGREVTALVKTMAFALRE